MIERCETQVTDILKKITEFIPKLMETLNNILSKLPQFVEAIMTMIVKQLALLGDMEAFYKDEKRKLLEEFTENFVSDYFTDRDELYLDVKCYDAIDDAEIDKSALSNAKKSGALLSGVIDFAQEMFELLKKGPDGILKFDVHEEELSILELPNKVLDAIANLLRAIGELLTKITSIEFWIEQILEELDKMPREDDDRMEDIMDITDVTMDIAEWVDSGNTNPLLGLKDAVK